MNPRLKIIANRIDARTLRERTMLFAAAAAAIVFLLYALILNPLLVRRAALQVQIAQQQDNIGGIDREITQLVEAHAQDPDAAARAKLATFEGDTAQLAAKLRAMQKGLVPPDRIAPLLETILKANGRLQLVSMKTLAVSPLAAAGAPASAPVAASPRAPVNPNELLYRHGVELTVRGNYLDMVNYMDALEAMPTQLFWGQAGLEVEEYPNARLTLTLYTLSLERKWIKL